MFTEFSSAYYLGRLQVERYTGSYVVMQSDEHTQLNKRLHQESESNPSHQTPLVMKLENYHVPVHSEDAVPSGMLAVPSELAEELRIDEPPVETEVLLAKPDRAEQLLWMQSRLPSGEFPESVSDLWGVGE